jgi:hypothetical protein
VTALPGPLGRLGARAARAGLGVALPGLRFTAAAAGMAAGVVETLLEHLDAGADEGRTDQGTAPSVDVAAAPTKIWTPPEPTVPEGTVRRRPAAETDAAREVGAPGANTAEADAITQDLADELADDLGGASLEDAVTAVVPDDSADLPVPDWDQLTVGRLQTRVRSLPLEDLLILRLWEQTHADRLQVLTMLENRIARRQAEEEAANP